MVALTAKLVDSANGQTVQLPQGVRLPGSEVLVRQQGASLILEPVGLASWPDGFFAAIQINDSRFQRPPQGEIPEIEPLDV